MRETDKKPKSYIYIIKVGYLIPFISSMMDNVVPKADKTAAVQQISPIHEGK